MYLDWKKPILIFEPKEKGFSPNGRFKVDYLTKVFEAS